METAYVPAAGLEVRRSGDGRHELEGLCVPYDEVTHKAGHPEVFRAGAFAGIAAAAAAKIRLIDENHAKGRRPVGVATRLAETAVGLHGTFRFYDTPEGRAAFENVAEETYGGLSVGFVAVRDRIVAGTREVLEARLHHVALADEPAYDGARIVAVRAAAQYEWMRTKPDVDLDDLDDTPMSVRVRRALGDVRVRA